MVKPCLALPPGQLPSGNFCARLQTLLLGVLAIMLVAAPATAGTVTTATALSTASVTDGIWLVQTGVNISFKLFGSTNLSQYSTASFTESSQYCDNLMRDTASLYSFSDEGDTARVDVQLTNQGSDVLYLCLTTNAGISEHQGDVDLIKFRTYVVEPEDDSESIPTGLKIVFVVILLMLSGLFSGLNLGLMALDTEELGVVMKVGTEKERRFAKRIYPLRKRGNLLLCTVLLGNVLVNAVLTLLLDTLFGGAFAIVFATLGIVIFGEIIPQAVCTRHGLRVGSISVPIIIFFMMITFPLAFPISKVLDWTLGDELGTVFNRHHLVEMLKVQDARNDLDKEEVEIVTGALTYADRSVSEIMTKLEDVYMLPIDAILDFKTISEIFGKGHSRIPVYDTKRENIIGILFMKELAFVDPDDCTDLSTIVKFYKHKIEYVDNDTMLDTLLEMFIQGRYHMAIVQNIVDPGDGRDIYRKNVGVVTLEDVIEEIIQAEIVDETDVIKDNRSKARVASTLIDGDSLYPKELEALGGDTTHDVSALSEQMSLAAFTFLSANVDGFSDESVMSKSVLLKLINRKECVVRIDEDSSAESRVLFTVGMPVNRFILVLEGRVRVTVGSEQFGFDRGPFSEFGTKALTGPSSSTADFSATVQSDSAILLIIPRALYLEAAKATKLGQFKKNTPLVERSKKIAQAQAQVQPSPMSDTALQSNVTFGMTDAQKAGEAGDTSPLLDSNHSSESIV